MIGKSKLHSTLRRGATLSDALAWYDFFTVQNRKLILDLVRYKQLNELGIDKHGDVIGYYSYATEIISQGRKQEGDPYTLDDTGEFYKSMFISVFQDLFEINADAQKGDENLFEKYGSGIVGLTDRNLDLVIVEIRKSYVNYARKVLFRIK